MKLSECIAKLQDIKDQFSDFEVVESPPHTDAPLAKIKAAEAPYLYRLYTGEVVVVV